jgi:Rrf2 family protein
MKLELTRRGDYAVRAMLALAKATDGRPLSVRSIAASMAIPPAILPGVMRELVQAGLAQVQAGRGGGYRLSRPAAEIDVLAVVEAIEGDTRRVTCVLRGGPCGRDGHCDAHQAFFTAQEAFRGELCAATLDRLVAN